MIRITDITMCSINYNTAQKEKLLLLYRLLLQTGINFIEINTAIFDIIGEDIDYNKTLLRVRHPSEIGHYPGFGRYICRHSGFDVPAGTISEVQINDIREINLINSLSDYQNVRIVGMDDLLQQDYINIFKRLRKNGSYTEFCPQNSFYCATALAVEWILSGGENIVAGFCGSGGVAALEEVIMALRIAKRYKPNMDLSVLRKIKLLYEELTGSTINRNKAVVGDTIFDVESGIHVDGIFKNGANYEPFEPSIVGMERKIIIGKHSGRTTIEIKLDYYDITYPQEKIPELLTLIQNESIKLGRSLTDDEFVRLAEVSSV